MKLESDPWPLFSYIVWVQALTRDSASFKVPFPWNFKNSSTATHETPFYHSQWYFSLQNTTSVALTDWFYLYHLLLQEGSLKTLDFNSITAEVFSCSSHPRTHTKARNLWAFDQTILPSSICAELVSRLIQFSAHNTQQLVPISYSLFYRFASSLASSSDVSKGPTMLSLTLDLHGSMGTNASIHPGLCTASFPDLNYSQLFSGTLSFTFVSLILPACT